MASVTVNPGADDLIDHEEVAGSPTESFTAEGFTAVRVLKCAWADRLTLAAQLQGYVIGPGLSAAQSAPAILIGTPHQYPHFKAATCREVSIAPVGKSQAHDANAQVIGYVAGDSFAQLTVTYRTPRPGEPEAPVDGETIFTERLEPSAEFLTIPAKGLTWSDGTPLEVEEAPGRVVRMLDYVVTVHQSSYLPNGWDLTDVVNAQAVVSLSLNRTFAPETLLYAGCQPERIYTSKGAQAWSYTMRLQYRKSGWNRFFRAGFADPQEINSGEGTFKPYTPAAFDFLP